MIGCLVKFVDVIGCLLDLTDLMTFTAKVLRRRREPCNQDFPQMYLLITTAAQSLIPEMKVLG